MKFVMRSLIIVLTLLAGVALSGNRNIAQAAELLMFESESCTWCETWHREVGVIYGKTAEGRQAPLRRLEEGEPVPADIQLKTTLRYTPTFVLLEKGREIGRIQGYPGESNFWALLGEMLKNSGPEPVLKQSSIEFLLDSRLNNKLDSKLDSKLDRKLASKLAR